MISALPDIKHIKLTPKDEFMVIACDGIFNSMENEAVVEFVRCRIQQGETQMAKICEEVKRTPPIFPIRFNFNNAMYDLF